MSKSQAPSTPTEAALLHAPHGVLCPVTDDANENGMRVGALLDINSRIATVLFSDGTIVKVGKTKIEALEAPEKRFPPSGPKKEKKEPAGIVRRMGHTYQVCKAASGKRSCDNGDAIANLLRGQSIDFAYQQASLILGVPESTLRDKYKHLNAGQQRMCLGVRMRAAVNGGMAKIES